MIAPTDIYKAFPTLTPEEAAMMLCDAMIDGPKKEASRLGHLRRGALLALAGDGGHHPPPGLRPVPGLEGRQGEEEGRRREDRAKPADSKKDEEMSTEAVAMAYLMRGVHF